VGILPHAFRFFKKFVIAFSSFIALLPSEMETENTHRDLKRFCSDLQRLLPNYSGYFQEKRLF